MQRTPPASALQQAAGLKVLLLQPQAENAGAQEISRMLSAALIQRGYIARQLFFYRRTSGFDEDPTAVFCWSTRPSNPISLLALLLKLDEEIRGFRPDVVLCFQHYGNLIGAPVARLAGARSVVANQSSASAVVPFWARQFDRWLGSVGIFTRIVVHSDDSAAEFARHPVRYRERLVHIEHGFQPKVSRRTKIAAREDLKLPSGEVILGCAARLHPFKRLDRAIRLIAHRSAWRLAIAGQGAGQTDLVELASSLGCLDRLHLLGELPSHRIADFLTALDAFVFPSDAETFGLAAVEAAQAGVPTVANDLPVLREVLAVGGLPCALFVDADNIEAFADGVDRVLGDAELRATLCHRAGLLAQRFAMSSMVNKYDALIRECRVTA